jgi:dTDP-4-amino-4,6-dideoxygalactose transaminase
MRDAFQEINEVLDTRRSDWITTGPKVKRFERDFTTNRRPVRGHR